MFAAGLEVENARVFEEAVHGAGYADVLALPRDAGLQAADTAHEQVDAHVRLRGPIKRANDVGIDQGIHLGDDVPLAAVAALALDEIENALLEPERRHREALPRGRRGISRNQIEQGPGVVGEILARGEIGNIAVGACGRGIVVAGGKVDIAADDALLPANHQRDFAMGLESDQTIDHVHARLFQHARPGDVAAFVEARLDLHDGGDLFAILGRANERADDR